MILDYLHIRLDNEWRHQSMPPSDTSKIVCNIVLRIMNTVHLKASILSSGPGSRSGASSTSSSSDFRCLKATSSTPSTRCASPRSCSSFVPHCRGPLLLEDCLVHFRMIFKLSSSMTTKLFSVWAFSLVKVESKERLWFHDNTHLCI